MSFTWIPNRQLDEKSLKRLQENFQKPSEPPPVAWFMSREVEYYEFITGIEPNEIPLRDLDRYFSDTCAGLKNFPDVKFAVKSWKATFNYLLPRLLPRSNEGTLLNDLYGYFFRVYPDSIPELYPQFRDDILNTLGQAIMSQVFWSESDLAESIIESEWQIYHLYGENSFVSTLSPAIYFCLKYLTPSEIDSWFDSFIQIKGRYWNYNFLRWLFAENFQLLIRANAKDLPEYQIVKPKLNFGYNSYMEEFTLPTENIRVFVDMLQENKLYFE